MTKGPDNYDEYLAQREQKGDKRPAVGTTSRRLSRIVADIEKYGWLRYEAKLYRELGNDSRHTDPEEKHWRYHVPSLGRTLFFGLLAVSCFIGQGYVRGWNEGAGQPLGAYAGFVRLGIMLCGAVLAFIAWPKRVPKDHDPDEWEAEMDERRKSREDFRKRHGR